MRRSPRPVPGRGDRRATAAAGYGPAGVDPLVGARRGARRGGVGTVRLADDAAGGRALLDRARRRDDLRGGRRRPRTRGFGARARLAIVGHHRRLLRGPRGGLPAGAAKPAGVWAGVRGGRLGGAHGWVRFAARAPRPARPTPALPVDDPVTPMAPAEVHTPSRSESPATDAVGPLTEAPAVRVTRAPRADRAAPRTSQSAFAAASNLMPRGTSPLDAARSAGILAMVDTSALENRTGLAKLMQAAGRGRIDVVLVWKLDRFGRSALDLLANLRALEDAGVRFTSITQGLDLRPDGDAMSRLMLTMLGVVAEFERLSAPSPPSAPGSGMAKARADGKRVGRPRSPGPSAAQVRRLRKRGVSWRELAAELGCTVWVARQTLAEKGAEKPPSKRPPKPPRGPLAAFSFSSKACGKGSLSARPGDEELDHARGVERPGDLQQVLSGLIDVEVIREPCISRDFEALEKRTAAAAATFQLDVTDGFFTPLPTDRDA